MKKAFLALLLLHIGIMTYAQTGGLISGIVKDKSSISLPGASLKLDKYNRYTIADEKGYYEFLNVPEGSYTLEVSYIGFHKASYPVTVTAKNNVVVNIVLNENSIEGEEVVIMGEMLRGQAKALNQQKTNSNVTNVISSDQVGRFPDSNIGDALKRVTGITMQNDQGEARNIIIRGIAPHLNSVTLNGNRIPSAEGDNRNVQMDLVPADMISTIEVSKTLTSDMDADAIGGSVDLVTRATPNKQRISATISGGYNPIREKNTYSGAFVYGNRFVDNKLGVVVSGSLQNKDYGSDNIEAEWDKDEFGNVYIVTSDIRKYDVQRVRRSISSSLDFKFDANNSISADLIYNWRDDRENRYRARYTKIEPKYDANNNITSYEGQLRRETKGGIDNSRNKNRRLEDQRVQNYLLRGQHLVSATMDLDWNLSYSKASEDRPNERYIEYRQKKLAITQDLSDERYPLLSATGADPSKMNFENPTENHNYTSEDEYSAKINARIPLSIIDDQKGRLHFGVRARIKNKERDNIFYEYKPSGNFPKTLADAPQSHYNGKDFQPGSQYAPGVFASKEFLGSLNLADKSLFEGELVPDEYLAGNYKAKEKIFAGYLRWDQNLTNDMLIILGIRAEGTWVDYTGNYVTDEEFQKQIEDDNSYLNILPSITYKYNIQDNLILRAAYTTALARPNYYDLVPYTNIVSKDQELSVGNSNLKVTYSHNFDVMVEYYLSSVGIVSGGVFYKNLNNFIYKYKDMQYNTDKYAKDFPELSNPIPTGEKWEFTQSRNGKGVDIFGFEVALQRKLDFLPTSFLRNFAVYLNYTYMHSKAKGIADEDGNERNNISLPGTAPHMFNASLSWENKKFSARASLNTTSSYIDVLGASEFYDSYYDKQLFLDVNASYKIIPSLRVFAEANNLTNQPLRYYQGSKDRIMQLEYYRPTFNIGIKFDL